MLFFNYLKHFSVKSGVILGQNCVKLPGAALNVFFCEIWFKKKQCKYAVDIGGVQGRDVLIFYKSVLFWQQSALCRLM